jgi:hypothetical protein
MAEPTAISVTNPNPERVFPTLSNAQVERFARHGTAQHVRA